MNESVMLRDLAMIMSSELYKKSIRGIVIPRTVRRIEYSMKSETGKRTVSDVTKSVEVKSNTVVIIPKRGSDVFYIPFVLDSFYVRNGLLEGKINIRKLTTVPIVEVSEEDKDYYGELETTLLTISKMDEDRLGYEYFYAAERLFADIRDGIVFELYQPDLLHSENIYLAEHWKKEVNNLRSSGIERGYNSLVAVINSLLKPGNMLYDNLKRFYLLVDKYKG